MLAQVSALAFRIAETVGRPPRVTLKNLPLKTHFKLYDVT
ncbi:hypothetical protein SAMN02787142_4754 [Burkholderia sp. WP9]|nr:hypothetical protein SAMN02787142_4754 [Burkholderia sp. WP9]